MILKEQIQRIALKRNNPCVSISLNTHRTHPDNLQDGIKLKNMLNEAKERILNEFDKKTVASLLTKTETIAKKIDINNNLDSLHIFVSNDTEEIIRSTWATANEGVQISDSFAVRPLIKSYNRSQNYLLMLLSQNGVQLFEAVNDGIVMEIKNEDFPFPENPHIVTDTKVASDPKKTDNMVREFLNKIDKALVKVHNETGLSCVVICTEDNYSRLQQVADKPSVYLEYQPINYNNILRHKIAQQAWVVVKELQEQQDIAAVEEIMSAVSQAKVLTDIQEIYQAAIDGRGDLLVVSQDFAQPVKMIDERTFEPVDDVEQPKVVDDIISTIAWEILSKNGKVVFTTQENLQNLGKIALKVRY